MKNLLLLLIKLYQTFLSPLIPPCCRFYPSCSNYALIAIKRFGTKKGIILSISRILRCNPFSKGGYDPVPEKDGEK